MPRRRWPSWECGWRESEGARGRGDGVRRRSLAKRRRVSGEGPRDRGDRASVACCFVRRRDGDGGRRGGRRAVVFARGVRRRRCQDPLPSDNPHRRFILLVLAKIASMIVILDETHRPPPLRPRPSQPSRETCTSQLSADPKAALKGRGDRVEAKGFWRWGGEVVRGGREE